MVVVVVVVVAAAEEDPGPEEAEARAEAEAAAKAVVIADRHHRRAAGRHPVRQRRTEGHFHRLAVLAAATVTAWDTFQSDVRRRTHRHVRTQWHGRRHRH